MKYTTLLFDSDDTLLNFQAAEKQAKSSLFSTFAPAVYPEIMSVFNTINRRLWVAYENGEISKADIYSRRFSETFAEYNLPMPDIDLSEYYQDRLAENHDLIPHVNDVLKALHGRYALYIITNSQKSTQERRLRESGIDKYFGKFFISEEMGTQKPSAKFFDMVFDELGISRKEALIIGDSYSSDITGGINAGVDTCWLNTKGSVPTGEAPTYEIKSLTELLEIL